MAEIPERWKEVYEACKLQRSNYIVHQSAMGLIIEELGAAEADGYNLKSPTHSICNKNLTETLAAALQQSQRAEAAEARIRELEQERELVEREVKGARAQLWAVTQERDRQRGDSLDQLRRVNIRLANVRQKLRAQLQAVTQERDGLRSDVAVYQGSTFASKRDLASTIAQLQARNSELREALQEVLKTDVMGYAKGVAEVALTRGQE